MKTSSYIKFAAEIPKKSEKIYSIFILRLFFAVLCIISGCFICFLFENERKIQDFFSIVICLIIFLSDVPLKFEMKKRMMKIMDSKIKLKKFNFSNFSAFFVICLIKKIISEIFMLSLFIFLDFAYKNIIFNADTENMFENIIISSAFCIISLLILFLWIYLSICFFATEFFYITGFAKNLFSSLILSFNTMKNKADDFLKLNFFSFFRFLLTERFFYVQAAYFYIALMEYENGVLNKWNEKNLKRKSKKKCCLENF